MTKQKYELVLVVFVLVLACFLRLYDLGVTEFKADEARLLSLAWDMAEGDGVAVRGISSSVGVPNFPASVWVYALPLLVWKSVYGATFFTGLLNTVAVGLCYWLVRRYWGWQAAVAATLMFAVSPWAVVHARKIWAQNLLPVFVLGWGISGLLAFHEGRKRWLLPHLVLAAVAFQIHLAAVSLIVGSGLFVLVFRRHLATSWKWLLAGGVGALTTAVPFIYYLLFQNEIPVRALLSSGGSGSGGASWNAFLHTFRLYSGWQIHALAGGEQFENYLGQIGLWSLLPWAWLLLAGLGLAVLIQQARTAEPARFLLIWLGASIGTFIWFPTTVELHYLLPTYPVLFIAAGVGIAWLLERLRPVWVWVGLGVTAVGQVIVWLVLLGIIGRVHTPGGFGELLSHQLAAVDVARTWVMTGDATEVLVLADGEEPEQDNIAAIYALHLRDIPHRFVAGGESVVFPENPAVVLRVLPKGELDRFVAAVAIDEQVIARREGEGPLSVSLLPGDEAPILAESFEPIPLLANWVNLLGYEDHLESGGWLVSWRVGVTAPVDYHFFNHLLVGDGARVAQVDGAGFGAGQWHEGDVVISYFAFDETLADYEGERPWTMRVGMYVYPSLENVPLLDVAGNPYTDATDVVLP